MNDLASWLFSSPGFMPHGHCYLWQPATLWLNVGSDGLIAAAYFAIPLSLYSFVKRRIAEIPFPAIFLMFAAFILLCGSTHLMEIWTVWNPAYRLSGVLKLGPGRRQKASAARRIRSPPDEARRSGPAGSVAGHVRPWTGEPALDDRAAHQAARQAAHLMRAPFAG